MLFFVVYIALFIIIYLGGVTSISIYMPLYNSFWVTFTNNNINKILIDEKASAWDVSSNRTTQLV